MTARSVSLLLIFLVITIDKRTFADNKIIDINTANIALKWPIDLSTCLQTTTQVTSPPTCPESSSLIYPGCNTIDPCQIEPSPCLNGGSCHLNTSLYSKYYCQCPDGFVNDDCGYDNRTCKNNTCWHDGECIEIHEIISRVNTTTFDCDCKDGYDGEHCELLENLCANITCKNRGICSLSYLNWTCKCPGSTMFYGRYCEYKTTSLIVREVLSKSFASVAIIAITTVCLFVIIMDILKYGFGIDPIDRERRLMRLKQEKKRTKKKTKKKRTKNALGIYHIA